MPVTFHIPGLCANLPLDTVQSRSNTRPQLWPTRCRLSGPSIRAFEIASRPSRDKCGEHINIFIGDEHVRYTGGLASPVSAGSKISIVPAVSGG